MTRTMARVGLAALTLALTGCGGDRAEVSGTVRLNGEPVAEGSITFIPVEGTHGPEAGGRIADGRYHIPRDRGVVVGKNRVELRAFRDTGRTIQDPTGQPGARVSERVPAFPPEYSDRSTIVKDIHPGLNAVDFDVRAAPAK